MDKRKDKQLHTGHRERVRKRFLKSGLNGFEDHQVLEFLLFYCYPRCDTNEIAHRMINEFGTLANLFEADALEIARRCNVTENVAVCVALVPALARHYFLSKWSPKSLIDSSQKAGRLAIALCTGATVECFYIICLDKQRRLIYPAKLFEGTLAETPIYPREVVSTVLKYHAATVILAHNHPSGMLTPSRSDIEATKKLIAALKTVGVDIIDHIVVAGDQYFSFAEKKLLSIGY